MAQESFDVMISDQQYKELKQFKTKNIQLQTDIQKLEDKVRQHQKSNQQFLELILKRDVQIGFLVSLVQEVASGSNTEQENEPGVMKSNTFQLLGQSMIDPMRGQEKKIEAIKEELNTRYQPLLRKVYEVEQRINTQEALITKLNQMRDESSKSVMKQKQCDHEKFNEEIKILKLEMKNKSCMVDQLKVQNDNLKVQLKKLSIDAEKRIAAVQENSQKLLSQAQKSNDNASLRNELKLVTKRLQQSNNRINDLQIENTVLKQGLGSSTFSKDETKDKLKALIDEYVREVERNLKSIGGLNETQIKELMQHEMKEIRDYIPKFGVNGK